MTRTARMLRDTPKRGAPWIAWSDASSAPRLRLLCFPYAGGGPAVFRRWPQLFSREVEILAVQMPGRAARMAEAPYRTVADMVSDVVAGLAASSDAPFALFGHSLGGLVAFEVCRALRRRAAPLPEQLFVSATPAPHLPRRDRSTSALSDAALVDRIRRWNGTPPEVLGNREMMELVLPGIRADLAAVDVYEHEAEPPLDLPVTVFGGHADRMVERSSLDAWSAHTTAEFRLEMVPGDHFFLTTHETVLVALLQEMLDPLLRRLPAREIATVREQRAAPFSSSAR